MLALAWPGFLNGSFIPAVDNVALFLVLGMISAMLFAVAKAGFGGSLGLLSVPLMIYACGGKATLALGIMLPLLIAGDYFALIGWWRKWDNRAVLLLLPGAIVGIGLGTWAMWEFQHLRSTERGDVADQSEAVIRLCIGLIALGFVVLQIVRSLRAKPLAFRPVFWQGTAVGGVAGFTSTLAHAAGPVVTMYMLPQQMDRGRFVASTVFYFWIGNQLKIPSYFFLHMLNGESIRASLLLVPAVIFGTFLGLFLHNRVGARQFTAIVYILLSLAGVDLVVKAVQALWM